MGLGGARGVRPRDVRMVLAAVAVLCEWLIRRYRIHFVTLVLVYCAAILAVWKQFQLYALQSGGSDPQNPPVASGWPLPLRSSEWTEAGICRRAPRSGLPPTRHRCCADGGGGSGGGGSGGGGGGGGIVVIAAKVITGSGTIRANGGTGGSTGGFGNSGGGGGGGGGAVVVMSSTQVPAGVTISASGGSPGGQDPAGTPATTGASGTVVLLTP